MRILALVVGFYAFGALVGALFALQMFPITAPLVVWKVALWLAAVAGFVTAFWLWRKSPKSVTGLGLVGAAWLLVVWCIPFIPSVPNTGQFLVAEAVGSVLWIALVVSIIAWLRRRFARAAA